MAQMDFHINYLILFMVVSMTSCTHEKKIEKEKTMMHEYVSETFDRHSVSWNQEFSYFFDRNERDTIPRKEIIIYPGGFKIKKFTFSDGQEYIPFVIVFYDSLNNLKSLFSFADEIYYLDYYDSTKVQNLKDLCNIEKNFNLLIKDLNYENSHYAISNLIKVVFHDMLNMYPVQQDELKKIIQDTEEKYDNENSLIRNVIQEYNSCINNPFYCIHTNEGLYGFWKYNIIEDNNEFYVEFNFIGYPIYNCLYI